MSIGKIWNKLADPKVVPRLFAAALAILLIAGLFVPFALESDSLYLRPSTQTQIDDGNPFAPYFRGGDVLSEPGTSLAQYPENSENLGMITSYLTPVAIALSEITPFFGTSICASPGGILDEILYYTRGFDTILESSILMMAFVIASWLAVNYTMNRKNEEGEIKNDLKKAIKDSNNVANEVKKSDIKARNKQLRREN